MTARAALAAALLAFATTCAPIHLGEGTRRAAMRELTEQVVVPQLERVASTAEAMAAAVRALADAPSQATLDAAQDAWRAARVPWKESEAYAFGPAMTERFGAAMDQVPVDPDKIEADAAATPAITDAYIDGLGANRKGFHAVEYLIFPGAGTDADVLAALTASPRRRELAAALARGVARVAAQLRTAWIPTAGGGYAETLTTPGGDNATYPTIKTVIDAFVNESVFLAELVADARLGAPLGLASGGDPRPDLQESGPSDNSLDDAAATVRGMRAVYTGAVDGSPGGGTGPGGGGGIGGLVAARSPATDRELREAFEAALAALAAVPRPFRTAVVDHRAEVQAAYDAVKELKRILGSEVVGLLGATLSFNDNDGD